MRLTDEPVGDSISIIYRLKGEQKYRLFHDVMPRLDDNGNYYHLTFEEYINEIETQDNKKISHFTMLAEYGLEGHIYKYNNYGKMEIEETGTTRGYA